MSASVAPEIASFETADDCRLRRRRMQAAWLVLGLMLIVAANHVIRHHLEGARLPAYPIFPGDRVPLDWRLLLPGDLGAAENAIHTKGTYHWFTTGTTVVKIAEQF